ncbi:MAG: hypothetical protein CSYNP_04133 [Syntrophus sp. SKADARSKE-3]|nr:hypothetical protein [Syntrophus sp. SKADARSKE-3]
MLGIYRIDQARCQAVQVVDITGNRRITQFQKGTDRTTRNGAVDHLRVGLIDHIVIAVVCCVDFYIQEITVLTHNQRLAVRKKNTDLPRTVFRELNAQLLTQVLHDLHSLIAEIAGIPAVMLHRGNLRIEFGNFLDVFIQLVNGRLQVRIGVFLGTFEVQGGLAD